MVDLEEKVMAPDGCRCCCCCVLLNAIAKEFSRSSTEICCKWKGCIHGVSTIITITTEQEQKEVVRSKGGKVMK